MSTIAELNMSARFSCSSFAQVDWSNYQQNLQQSVRQRAGYGLPPYYLVYFLLVELLGFDSLGQAEKVAWSVPITFEGKVYVIEHRKMGLGVFAEDARAEEQQPAKIALLIRKAVNTATPFFELISATKQ